jgi:hypothetical protein
MTITDSPRSPAPDRRAWRRRRRSGRLADVRDDGREDMAGDEAVSRVEPMVADESESDPGQDEPSLGTAAGDSSATDDAPATDDGSTVTEGSAAGGAEPTVVYRWRWWPTVACAVLAVIGFAGTGYFGRAWLDQRSTNNATTSVKTASANFVSALTNFDPGTVDSDFTRIEDDATGPFASQAQSFFGTSIRQQLIAADAASRGQVRDLFVEAINGGQATVFVVVDQQYENSKSSHVASDTLRLELGLTDVSGRWLISSVDVLQSPTGFVTPTG